MTMNHPATIRKSNEGCRIGIVDDVDRFRLRAALLVHTFTAERKSRSSSSKERCPSNSAKNGSSQAKFGF